MNENIETKNEPISEAGNEVSNSVSEAADTGKKEAADNDGIDAVDVLSEQAEKNEEKRQAKLAAKAAKKEARLAAKSAKKERSDGEAAEASKSEDTERQVNSADEEAAAAEELDEDGNPVAKRRRRKKFVKTKRKPEEVNIVKELLSLIVYIGIVVLACYLIINFVGCRSRVDGSSMETTLSDGDNLWVDKLTYTFGDPDRFDVIIFNYDEDTTYVKRIIGLPGETVRIDQSGNIYINEKLLKENYGNETILPTNLGRANQPVVLGDNEYFVLGDNRNNSSDSRWADVGNVNREDIIGKVILRIYPFTSFGIIK